MIILTGICVDKLINCSYSYDESNKHDYLDEYEADKVFVNVDVEICANRFINCNYSY